MSKRVIKYEIECTSCNATGLYKGFAESESVAVICRNCEGTGCMVISGKPFTGRKRKRGVKKVYRDVWWVRSEEESSYISAKEFYEKTK